MSNSRRKHVVLLLHGIRTQAEWGQQVAAILAETPTIRAIPIRYEYLDIVRFLLPFKAFRQRPVTRIISMIREELSRARETGAVEISVIAHSFGTYCFSQVLQQARDIKFHRVILCGSIVQDDFEWEHYRNQISSADWQILNDCGMKDVLPVLAKSITWGYGSSGRFGFGHVWIKDRYFDVGHSGFFSAAHVRKFWLPYLSRGEIIEGNLMRATNPWWVSALTFLKIRYLPILALVLYASISLSGDDSNVSTLIQRIASGLRSFSSRPQRPEGEIASPAAPSQSSSVTSLTPPVIKQPQATSQAESTNPITNQKPFSESSTAPPSKPAEPLYFHSKVTIGMTQEEFESLSSSKIEWSVTKDGSSTFANLDAKFAGINGSIVAYMTQGKLTSAEWRKDIYHDGMVRGKDGEESVASENGLPYDEYRKQCDRLISAVHTKLVSDLGRPEVPISSEDVDDRAGANIQRSFGKIENVNARKKTMEARFTPANAAPVTLLFLDRRWYWEENHPSLYRIYDRNVCFLRLGSGQRWP